MKFRMFNDYYRNDKVAVNVDNVLWVDSYGSPGTLIVMANGGKLVVEEDYQTVISRLNTIAE